MIKDLRNLIFLYTDADEYYLLRKAYKLSVKFYCKNVDMIPTKREKSYLIFAKIWPRINPYNITWASYVGYLGVVKFLYKSSAASAERAKHIEEAVSMASFGGHLQIVKFFHLSGIQFPTDAMDYVCYSRVERLEIIQFLHEIGAPCTTYAMDWASCNGHFKVVEYLHTIGKPCTANAINEASRNGHFKVVEYLHKIGKPFTEDAINDARKNGHLDIVAYLEKIEK